MTKYNKFYKKESMYFGDEPSDGVVDAFVKYNIQIGNALDIGAGEGRNSHFLATKGFHVTAIEPNHFGVEKIKRLNSDINVVCSNFLEFNTTEKYSFILAGTSLDQMSGVDVPQATEKIINLLEHGGFAYIVVFTEDDPEASECAGTVSHYFKRNELLSLFTHKNIEVLFYDEYVKLDTTHGEPHYHGKAKIIVRKK